MKKIVAIFLLLSTFTIAPSMPVSAAGTTDMMDEFVLMDMEMVSGAGTFKPCPVGTFRVRRKISTKKKLLNTAISTGIGAAIGAGVGGKRGAAIGAGGGAASYLTYRYIRDRKGRCVKRYY